MTDCAYRECPRPSAKVYFVEERRAASVGIHPRALCEEHVQEIAGTGVYIEEKQCDCSGFEHFFFGLTDDDGYGCPGPKPEIFNKCCGASDDDNVLRACDYGYCNIEFCGQCGTATGTAWGPVLCPCGKGYTRRWAPAERTMLKTPNGGEYNRRRKARVKRP